MLYPKISLKPILKVWSLVPQKNISKKFTLIFIVEKNFDKKKSCTKCERLHERHQQKLRKLVIRDWFLIEWRMRIECSYLILNLIYLK
jgi:hypothetical protein